MQQQKERRQRASPPTASSMSSPSKRESAPLHHQQTHSHGHPHATPRSQKRSQDHNEPQSKPRSKSRSREMHELRRQERRARRRREHKSNSAHERSRPQPHKRNHPNQQHHPTKQQQQQQQKQQQRVFYVEDDLDDLDGDFGMGFLDNERFRNLPSMMCAANTCDTNALDGVANDGMCTQQLPEGCSTQNVSDQICQVPTTNNLFDESSHGRNDVYRHGYRFDYGRIRSNINAASGGGHFSLRRMYARPTPERHSQAKAILNSTEQLELAAKRIRSELWHAELIELSLEAERAAESGQETFSAKASTFGVDMDFRIDDDDDDDDNDDDDYAGNHGGAPCTPQRPVRTTTARTTRQKQQQRQHLHHSEHQRSSQHHDQLRKEEDDDDGEQEEKQQQQQQQQHKQQPNEQTQTHPSPSTPDRLSKPGRVRRFHTYSEGMRTPVTPTMYERRKIRVTSLRDIGEVVPRWRELHVHVRTHLARRHVDDAALSFAHQHTDHQCVELLPTACLQEIVAEPQINAAAPPSFLLPNLSKFNVTNDDADDENADDVGDDKDDATMEIETPTVRRSANSATGLFGHGLQLDGDTCDPVEQSRLGDENDPHHHDHFHHPVSITTPRTETTLIMPDLTELETDRDISVPAHATEAPAFRITRRSSSQRLLDIISTDDSNLDKLHPHLSNSSSDTHDDEEKKDDDFSLDRSNRSPSSPIITHPRSSINDNGNGNGMISFGKVHMSPQHISFDPLDEPESPTSISADEHYELLHDHTMESSNGNIINVNNTLTLTPKLLHQRSSHEFHDFKTPSKLRVIRGPKPKQQEQPMAAAYAASNGADIHTPEIRRIALFEPSSIIDSDVASTSDAPPSMASIPQEQAKLLALPSMKSPKVNAVQLIAPAGSRGAGGADDGNNHGNDDKEGTQQNYQRDTRMQPMANRLTRRLQFDRPSRTPASTMSEANGSNIYRDDKITKSYSYDHPTFALNDDETAANDKHSWLRSSTSWDVSKTQLPDPKMQKNCLFRMHQNSLNGSSILGHDEQSGNARQDSRTMPMQPGTVGAAKKTATWTPKVMATAARNDNYNASTTTTTNDNNNNNNNHSPKRENGLQVVNEDSNDDGHGHEHRISNVSGAFIMNDMAQDLTGSRNKATSMVDDKDASVTNLSSASSLVEPSNMRCDWETLNQAATWSGKFAEETVGFHRVMSWHMVTASNATPSNTEESHLNPDDMVLASLHNESVNVCGAGKSTACKSDTVASSSAKDAPNQGSQTGAIQARTIDRQNLYFSETYNREFLDNYFYVSKDVKPKPKVEEVEPEAAEPIHQNFWVESCVHDAYCRDGMDDICNGVTTFFKNQIGVTKQPLTPIKETTVSVGRDEAPKNSDSGWLHGIQLSAAASKSFRNLAVLLSDSPDKGPGSNVNNGAMFQPPGLRKTCNWHKCDTSRNLASSSESERGTNDEEDHHPMAFNAYHSKSINDVQFEAMYGMSRDQFVILSKLSKDGAADRSPAVTRGNNNQGQFKLNGRDGSASTTEATDASSLSDMSSGRPSGVLQIAATVE